MTAPTTLVTGGAQGLGAALVRRLIAAGRQVAVADIDTEAGDRLAKETGCLFIRTDVGVFAENQAAVRATVERFGGLDMLCANAGVAVGAANGDDFDIDRYRRGMRVDLDGAVFAINAALPQLRARGGGAVLVTSSLAGISPATDPYYGAAKHALIGLARSFALILRAENIRVNAICPGFVDTRLVDVVREALTAHGFAIADADQVAEAAETVLNSPETGQVWEIQAGRGATHVTFPDVTLSRITEVPGAEVSRVDVPGEERS